MNRKRIEEMLPLIGVDGSCWLSGRGLLAGVGRSGAAAIADRDIHALGRYEWRRARLRFRQDRLSDRRGNRDRRRDRIPLGVVLGSSERLYRSLEFVIDFFRSTPASAMFPLFLVLFGVGDETKISVAAFGAVLVILLTSPTAS